MLKKQNLRISQVKKSVKKWAWHVPPHSDGVGPQKFFGVYLSLRATDKLMAKLFRITFYIVNQPNVGTMLVLRWHYTGTMLVLCQYCAGITPVPCCNMPVLRWNYTGTMLVLCPFCAGITPVQCWYYISTALALRQYHVGTMPVLRWYNAGTMLVICQYCAGITPVPCW